jgi:hypothetical protein
MFLVIVFAPGAEEESAKCGEEGPGLETGVHEVDGAQPLLGLGRQRLVGGADGTDAGEVASAVPDRREHALPQVRLPSLPAARTDKQHQPLSLPAEETHCGLREISGARVTWEVTADDPDDGAALPVTALHGDHPAALQQRQLRLRRRRRVLLNGCVRSCAVFVRVRVKCFVGEGLAGRV